MNIEVISGGNLDGNRAEILLNGKNVYMDGHEDRNGRGLHLVVINPGSQALVKLIK